MAIVGDHVLRQLIREFPAKCHYAFAYGSAVFAQKHQSVGKMIDLVFVVEHPVEWHRENLRLNPRHYSGLRFLGPKFITAVQERMACGVYYNPYCEVNGRLIKYGVISTEALKRDLEDWEYMYIAGRLHKPVLDVKAPNRNLTASLKRNRKLALSAALLQSEGIITKYQLFYKIAELSYHGDTRMRFAENPDKMKNIVVPLIEEFDRIYMPLLKELKSAVELPDDIIAQDLSPIARYHHLIKFPLHIQKSLVRVSNKDPRFVDIEDVLIDLTISSNLDSKIATTLAGVVRGSSIMQTAQGLLTAGIFKSTKYALEKLSKRFQKKKPITSEQQPPAESQEESSATRTISYVVPASKIVELSKSSTVVKKAIPIPKSSQNLGEAQKIIRPAIKEMSLIPSEDSNDTSTKSNELIKEHTIAKTVMEGQEGATSANERAADDKGIK